MFDIVIITGDAYMDHPMSGVAVIKKLLEHKGYSVAVIDQPDWRKNHDFMKYGKPRLFFAVTSGCMDSMLANYTPMKRKRKDKASFGVGRPDRAVIVYCNKLKELFKGVPIVIAGVEASTRRLAHYDYWDNAVRKSIILDSRADILVYGMGERQILEISARLKDKKDIDGIRGTCIRNKNAPKEALILPSYEEVRKSKEKFAESFVIQYKNRCMSGKTLAEPYNDCYILQYPPAVPLSTEEMDYIYELPYSRRIPKSYEGIVKMMEPVQFSIVSHRGCFGGCNFCSISFLQGKYIQSRSKESILREIKKLVIHPDFKGVIYDLGGASANMYGMQCKKKERAIIYKSIIDDKEKKFWYANCIKDCLPGPCKNLNNSHKSITEILKKARNISGVKNVFVRSGVRYDLIPRKDDGYLKELVRYHVSGQLKVAPEHCNEKVLGLMNKGSIREFEKFRESYEKLNKLFGKKQYLVPYLIVAHPACGINEAKELANYIKKNRISVEHVQVFTPTPMTLSTCMYYCGFEPFSGKRIYVPYSYREKKIQKRLLMA
ncbi:MAG: YgiQ family radical SAM protein [Candidatus Woesearchaeota archaeon]